jgi:hypothetical protein
MAQDELIARFARQIDAARKADRPLRSADHIGAVSSRLRKSADSVASPQRAFSRLDA